MNNQPTPRDLEAEKTIAALESDYAGMRPTLEVLRTLFLNIAAALIGVQEVGRSNAGYWVDRFLASCHLNPGQFWCQALLQWVLWEACRILVLPDIFPYDTASTRAAWDWAATRDLTVTTVDEMESGDMLIFSNGMTRQGHVALIERIERRGGVITIYTIEGNVGGGSWRNGGEVDRRQYTLADLRLRKPRSQGRWCRGAISLRKLYAYAKIDLELFDFITANASAAVANNGAIAANASAAAADASAAAAAAENTSEVTA